MCPVGHRFGSPALLRAARVRVVGGRITETGWGEIGQRRLTLPMPWVIMALIFAY